MLDIEALKKDPIRFCEFFFKDVKVQKHQRKLMKLLRSDKKVTFILLPLGKRRVK